MSLSAYQLIQTNFTAKLQQYRTIYIFFAQTGPPISEFPGIIL